ncbi:hypothetical protein CROQUDRAFT_105120 [Cronartium quercuum f. sp. fusiforme G11]|uniref:Uncharacterized protein n=1 Tax=Cronartium quercuum f. sp. fusiforme G11 TaxID=708437 RepID=A0A9P6NTU3_9BASI|nr:hypothetical protein CROQUDRAFT_105120 [Cronartium quercuum f. sp. fusiforme G11]
MSRLAKLTFVGATALTGMKISSVHIIQLSERDVRTMNEFVKRREQMARDQELDEKARRQLYLESLQPVSNPSGPRPQPRSTLSGDDTKQIKCED